MEEEQPDNELIEVINKETQKNLWKVVQGDETTSLLHYLKERKIDEKSEKTLLKEAVSIFAKCPSPNSTSSQITGLAVGYIQSGKTMSFTTVTALAHDNGYQIVIIIAGTSVPLFTQSTNRLKEDLRLDTRPDRAWQLFQNPVITKQDQRVIKSVLRDWTDETVPDNEKQTILITVMKNHTHLHNLIDVMSGIKLDKVPVLIIDDEADQAGLNTLVRKGEESTTYRQLVSLRKCFPIHAFLQYTATPQAPLLINIIDVLSPNFADVLSPGDSYVGGKDFFLSNSGLVKTIPDSQLSTKIDPPASLIEAMRLFFIGVRVGYIKNGGQGNRSMLVHPSQKTIPHTRYYEWVTRIKDNWEKTLQQNINDFDRKELIEEFRTSYLDLQKTADDLPSFEKILEGLMRAIRLTHVTKVNASRGKTPQVDWKATYPHILVGGQAMDRGFTVEGLTVTYMPRDTGVANADTIQQRARFFGYKRSYLGYCRVYLESNVLDAYRQYISHEEDIRKQLNEFHNKPLIEWKRAFFLTKKLKPTRDNVLSLDYIRGGFSDEWFAPKYPHYSTEAIISNTQTINNFIKSLNLHPDEGHKDRTIYQKHSVDDNVKLMDVFLNLLVQLRMTHPIDSTNYTGLLLQIKRYLENHPNEYCSIYLISYLQGIWKERKFNINEDNEIPNLFQGENPESPKELRGTIYPGDRRIRKENVLNIQVRNILINNRDIDKGIVNFPVITVYIPPKMGGDWLIQE